MTHPASSNGLGLLLCAAALATSGCKETPDEPSAADARGALADARPAGQEGGPLVTSDGAPSGDGQLPSSPADGGSPPPPRPDFGVPPGCTAECQAKELSLCLPSGPGQSCVACLNDGHCQSNPNAWGGRCGDQRTCGCEGDGDCTAAGVGHRCSATKGLCHCLSDADCDPDRTCMPQVPGGSFKHCQYPCADDDHCNAPERPSCDTSSGFCVVCANDGHCADSPQGGRCSAEGCSCVTDAHCAGASRIGPRCDGKSARCICVADADCKGNSHGPVCVGGRCGCNATGQCGAGTVCSLRTPAGNYATCVAPCQDDLECVPLGLKSCGGGRCINCTKDGECGGTISKCDTGLGRCVACLEAAHCTLSLRPHCDPGQGACVECLEHDHCTSTIEPFCRQTRCARCLEDKHCVDPNRPYCATNGNCVLCRTDVDCTKPELPFCLGASAACRECKEDAHCKGHPDGETCSEGDCGCKSDAACAGNPQGFDCRQDYKGGGTFDRFCGCQSDTQCPAGKTCDLKTERCESA